MQSSSLNCLALFIVPFYLAAHWVQALADILVDLVDALPCMFTAQLLHVVTNKMSMLGSTAGEAAAAQALAGSSSSGNSSSQPPSAIDSDMSKGTQLGTNGIATRLRTSMEQLVTDASVVGAAQRPAAWMPTNERLVGMMRDLTAKFEAHLSRAVDRSWSHAS
jgi:hypothetical protein